MSSFCASLSKNFADATFIKQICEIGFLAEFESLLSSLGNKCSTYQHDLIIILQETKLECLKTCA